MIQIEFWRTFLENQFYKVKALNLAVTKNVYKVPWTLKFYLEFQLKPY